MVDCSKGLAQLLINHRRSVGCAHEMRQVHCIIHQEELCANAKAAGMKNVMSVVELVNTVLARPPNHRVFKRMCEAAEADCGLLYHRSSVA